jgi:hypothetical protein
MEFGSFLSVMRRMEAMSCGDLRVVRGLLVVAGVMQLRRLPMVFCRDVVVFRRCFVVFCAFVSRHLRFSSFFRDFRAETSYSQSQISAHPRAK